MAEAERLGWPKDELYAAPPLWARVDLCGAGLLIGDREVGAVTAEALRIKTESGSILSFYRRPRSSNAIDIAGALAARITARATATVSRALPDPPALSSADHARIDWWIRSRLTDWRDNCWVCRRAFLPGQEKTAIANSAGAETHFHRSCYAEWRTEQEALARKALGLA